MKLTTVALAALLLFGSAFGQSQPTLEETFDWMTNTLKPSAGNNVGIHRPFPQTREDIKDAYNSETIVGFSHSGCDVTFAVDVFNNDEIQLGKWYLWHEVDTFNLKDIDPTSVRVAGTNITWDDNRGHVVVFRTTDARPRIHAETTDSSGKSANAFRKDKDETKTRGEIADELCKALGPSNTASCDYENRHGEFGSADETTSTFWFSTSKYSQRFAKALRHAVNLCGGKASAS